MTVTTGILTLFCERHLCKEEPEPPMAKPWRQIGRIWACDGRTLLAIPDDGREIQLGTKQFKDPDQELLVPITGELKPLPGPSTATEECEWCYGHGWTQVDCKHCEGKGEHFCEQCEEDHPCGKCHGRGTVNGPKRCPICQGQRVCPVDQYIDGVKFRGWLLQRIRLLGDVRYWLVDQDRLRFCGDGFDGLIMSMKEEPFERKG